MAAQAPAKQSATPNTNTAVQTVEGKAVINLDQFPEQQFNRLLPTQTVMQQSPFFKPVVTVVQLGQRDVYESRDLPQGNAAPNRVGLRKLATAAGVSFVDEHRTDDGSDPDVCGVSTTAEMVLPSGQRIRAQGVREIDLKRMTWSSDAQKGRYRSFLYEHCASRAQNRAIRALLSLQQSYPKQELQRPFAVATFVPDMDNPEVRARMLELIAPMAIEAGYGPEMKQVGPGVIEAPPAPDDEPTEASFREEPPHPAGWNGDGASESAQQRAETGDVDASTGEVREPDWFGDEKPASDQTLVDRLRAAAQANADTGPALQDQKMQLKELLAGVSTEEVLVVMRNALGFKGTAIREITAGQAATIIEVGSEIGADELRRQWVQVAA